MRVKSRVPSRMHAEVGKKRPYLFRGSQFSCGMENGGLCVSLLVFILCVTKIYRIVGMRLYSRASHWDSSYPFHLHLHRVRNVQNLFLPLHYDLKRDSQPKRAQTPKPLLDSISNNPNERKRNRSIELKSGLFPHPLLMTTNSQQCPSRRVNYDILDAHRVEVKKTQQKIEEDKALLMEKKSVKRESDAISDVFSPYRFQILERRGRASCGE